MFIYSLKNHQIKIRWNIKLLDNFLTNEEKPQHDDDVLPQRDTENSTERTWEQQASFKENAN